MKAIIATLFFVVLIAPSKLFADCHDHRRSSDHSSHSLFCPDTNVNLLGASYNPAIENWGWHMGVKTVLFHPTENIWMGGVGLGIAFDQSSSFDRGAVPVLTFIPLQISAFSVEISVNRFKSTDDHGTLKRGRLIVLAWNFF